MTWVSDLEYDSDASDASWDDSVVERSVWRGTTSPLDDGDWLQELEESLCHGMHDEDPVSYTHLTLPTILLV